MTRHKFQTLRDRYLTDPVERALVAEMTRAPRVLTALAELRDEAPYEPISALDAPGSDSRSVAQIARDDSLFLTTLKDGVAELGGRLEVVAVFPGQRVPLLEQASTESVSSPD